MDSPGAIWITGLSASGKTTLATALQRDLQARGHACTLLDGEALRERLSLKRGHSVKERFAVLREIVAFALEEQRSGVIPIVATISHKRDMRAYARRSLGRMFEVYLECAASVCAARDRKGHYRRAYAGDYECFIGVTEPYESWDEADLVIDTAQLGVERASRLLLAASMAFLGGHATSGLKEESSFSEEKEAKRLLGI